MDNILDNDELLALTKWHIQEQQLDKALINVKHILQSDNVSPEAILIAARLYAQLQLYSQAQKLFAQYLEVVPDDLNTQFQLGMSYFDTEDSNQALKVWEELLTKSENHPPALFYSAIILLRENNTDKATARLKVIIDTAQIDNLYYSKAKDLLLQVEKQPANLINFPKTDIYKNENEH